MTMRNPIGVTILSLLFLALPGCKDTATTGSSLSGLDAGGGGSVLRSVASSGSGVGGSTSSACSCSAPTPGVEWGCSLSPLCLAPLGGDESGGTRTETTTGLTTGGGTGVYVPPTMAAYCSAPGTSAVQSIVSGQGFTFKFAVANAIGYTPVLSVQTPNGPVFQSINVEAGAGELRAAVVGLSGLAPNEARNFSLRLNFVGRPDVYALCYGVLGNPVVPEETPPPSPTAVAQPMVAQCDSGSLSVYALQAIAPAYRHVSGNAAASIAFRADEGEVTTSGEIANGAFTAQYRAPQHIAVTHDINVYPVLDGIERPEYGCVVRLNASSGGDDGGYITPPTVARCGGDGGVTQFALAAQNNAFVDMASWPLNPASDAATLNPNLGNITEQTPGIWRYQIGQLPTSQTAVTVRFVDGLGRNTQCVVLVPQRGQFGYGTDGGTGTGSGTGTGTGTGGGTGSGSGTGGYTVQGIVGNVYDFLPKNLPYAQQFAMREAALPLPFTTVVLSHFDRPTWGFENGFPGVPDRTEWFQINFGGPSRTYAEAKGYDLEKIVKLKLNFPVAGRYSFSMNADDGANLFISDPENASQCHPTKWVTNGNVRNADVVAAGVQVGDGVANRAATIACVQHADYATSHMKVIVNNDGTHAPRVVEHPFTAALAGTRQIELDYYQGPRVLIALQLFWKLEAIIEDGVESSCASQAARVQSLGLTCDRHIVPAAFFQTEVGYH